MMGGQDELVFDGASILVSADGALLARGPQFEEALVVADLDLPAARGQLPGNQPVNADDGTGITIERGALPPPSGEEAAGDTGSEGIAEAAEAAGAGATAGAGEAPRAAGAA